MERTRLTTSWRIRWGWTLLAASVVVLMITSLLWVWQWNGPRMWTSAVNRPGAQISVASAADSISRLSLGRDLTGGTLTYRFKTTASIEETVAGLPPYESALIVAAGEGELLLGRIATE